MEIQQKRLPQAWKTPKLGKTGTGSNGDTAPIAPIRALLFVIAGIHAAFSSVRKQHRRIVAGMLSLSILCTLLPITALGAEAAAGEAISIRFLRCTQGGNDNGFTPVTEWQEGSGASLESVVQTLVPDFALNSNTLSELVVTAGTMTDADWSYLLSNGWQLKKLTFNPAVEVASVHHISNFGAFLASLEEIHYPQATEIGKDQFFNNGDAKGNLKIVEMPNVTKIGKEAFDTRTGLQAVNFPLVTELGQGTFHNTGLTSVSFPEVTAIPALCFNSCYSLTTASFPKVTTIAGSAFFQCKALASLSLPAVTTIGAEAFSGCSMLASLSLPASPPQVPSSLFGSCPATRKLTFVDATGAPLTGQALDTARANYKAVEDGNSADNLWYGWEITPREAEYIPTGSGKTFIGTFAEALKAMSTSGGSIKLLSAVDTAEAITLPGKAITLDLDGQTWTNTGITVPQACTLTVTVKNGSITRSSSGDAIAVLAGGTLHLRGGTVTAALGSAVNNQGTISLSGAPTLVAGGEHPQIEMGTSGTLIANDGAVSPTYFTGDLISVQVSSDAVADYEVVSGLQNAEHGKKFTLAGASPGLLFTYDDTAKHIKLETGWAIDDAGKLSILSAAGMIDWQAKGLTDENRAALKTATIAKTVTALPSGAFQQCANLTTVSAPGVGTIGENGFSGCVKLETMELPAQPPTVSNGNAFQDCPVNRGLILVDANGTALADTALAQARAGYQAAQDGNTTDNLWYGWMIINYRIAFDANGGSVSPESAIVGEDGKLDSLPTPTRSGKYRFEGWFTAESGGTEVTVDTVFTENTTIYAHWKKTGGPVGTPTPAPTATPTATPTPTVTPTPGPTEAPSQGETTVTTPVDQDGNASVLVSDESVNDAIEQAKENATPGQPIAVSIVVETDKVASKITATLPKTVQETLIGNKVNSITIVSDTVTMGFTQEAIQLMNNQAKADIDIIATKVDTQDLTGEAAELIGDRPLYDFTAIYNRIYKITDFGGNTVSLSIPYVLREGENPEDGGSSLRRRGRGSDLC